MKNWKPLLLIIAGALYALGFPFYREISLPFAPIAGISIFLYYLFKSESLKTRFFTLLLFSLGYNWVGFYWIPHTLTEFGNIPYFFSLLLAQAFALIILPQYLLAIFLIPLSKHISELFKIPILALLFTLLEYFIPQQFPAHLGHTWLPLGNFLTLAPYLGVPFYSYLSFLIALSIINFIKNRKLEIISPLFILLSILATLVISFPTTVGPEQKIGVRVVQADIGNAVKLASEIGSRSATQMIHQKYHDLSTLPTNLPIELIIWPETALPDDLSSSNFATPSFVSKILQETKSDLFIGGYDSKDTDLFMSSYYESTYNTAFHISSDDKLLKAYHKIKLIPFGETLPVGPLKKWASTIVTNISYFASGDEFTLFKSRSGIPFISLICYEILFPEFVRDFFNANKNDRPQFIINLTNDSWYGDTSEPYQHLFLAKWRALEFQVPVIRSTNTGITTIFSPRHLNGITIGINDSAVLDEEITVASGVATLYERFGILVLIFVFFIKLLFIYSFGKMRPSRSKS